ncbi:MAG TPA: hypothetical protein VJ499_06615 [Flavisolibacter sp.]|nr:hypothetical protein [Flavisolibacter sp.]
MKNYLFLGMVALLASCSNGSEAPKTTTTNEASPNTPVENVNGNVPDTINSISPDTRDKTKIDSSYVDSTKK